ncbi:MAG: type II secretion system F family protein [Minisyncoccia bacterium]
MKFFYRAKDKLGNVKTGVVEARSLDAALKLLQNYGLVVTDITPEKTITFFDQLFGRKTRISRKDLVVYLRQFATLLQSHVSLADALRTLMIQAATSAIRDLTYDLMSDLDAGLPLSKAMQKHEDVFGEYYVEMVRAGEFSGKLDEVLSQLADYAEYENDLLTKAKSSATYPAFLVLTFVAIGTLITTVLAPQMATIFDEFGKTPPLGTKILINIGDFLNHWGLIVLIILGGIITMILNYFHSEEGRRLLGIYLLKIPIIGGIYKKIYIGRFTKTASNLLLGGIPAVIAFQVAGRSTGNYVYQKISEEIAEKLKTGESINKVLSQYPEYFPPLVSQMTAVGETTGRLEEILQKVAEYYQKEVSTSFNTMVDLLQPILIIMIGFLVALLVSAVLLPIYQLAQGI